METIVVGEKGGRELLEEKKGERRKRRSTSGR